jgi:hypothetical protein
MLLVSGSTNRSTPAWLPTHAMRGVARRSICHIPRCDVRIQQLFVARGEEVCVLRERRGQERRIFGISREIRHVRWAGDIHRAHGKQFGPSLHPLFFTGQPVPPALRISASRSSA